MFPRSKAPSSFVDYQALAAQPVLPVARGHSSLPAFWMASLATPLATLTADAQAIQSNLNPSADALKLCGKVVATS